MASSYDSRLRRLGRLPLVELDEGENILPHQAADRSRAVLGDGNGPVGPDQKARGLKDLAPLLVEGPERACCVLDRQPVADRKREPELRHRLFRFFEGVYGARHNPDPLFPELLLRLLKGSQLLLAVRSPVASINQKDAPVAAEGIGEGHTAVVDRVDCEMRKFIAAIKDERAFSRHYRPLVSRGYLER